MTTESPAQTYIDLARLGRRDAWATTKAILRVVLYPVVFILVSSVILGLVLAFAPVFANRAKAWLETGGALVELPVILIFFLPVTWAVRDATVKSQRRPFLSLIGPDLRFDWRRFALGAAIWVAAILAVGLAAPLLPLDLPAQSGSLVFSWSLLPIALLALIVIPIQTGTEELLCRGWLTQLLGQAIRTPILVALLVAIFFAALHTLTSWVGFVYFMVASLAFSAISLRDGRLELAIGAHTGQNLFVLLVASPLADAGHGPSLLAADPGQMPLAELPLGLAIALLGYGLSVWLVPRLIGPGSGQRPPAHPDSAAI